MWWFWAATAVQTGAAYFEARAQAEALEESASAARIQGQIALANAKFSAKQQLKAGREQAGFVRRESRRAGGLAIAHFGASGIELSGSPLVAIAERIRRDEMNAARVITNAHARAASEEAQGRSAAAGSAARASSLESQASITRDAGFLNAIAIGFNASANYYALTGGTTPSRAPGVYGRPRPYAPGATVFQFDQAYP